MKRLLRKLYRYFRPIVIGGKGNTVTLGSRINGIVTIAGDGNQVKVGNNCKISNCEIIITGNGNCMDIADNVRIMGPCRIFLNGNATLKIGYNAGIRGVTFNVKDGSVIIGALCMFSYGINIRNHDSHKIIDPLSGNVTNNPADIVLGRHVWVCENASILKGVHIGDDAVVGYGAVVTRSCPAHAIVAGNPARIVKENVNWDY